MWGMGHEPEAWASPPFGIWVEVARPPWRPFCAPAEMAPHRCRVPSMFIACAPQRGGRRKWGAGPEALGRQDQEPASV